MTTTANPHVVTDAKALLACNIITLQGREITLTSVEREAWLAPNGGFVHVTWAEEGGMPATATFHAYERISKRKFAGWEAALIGI